MCKKRSKECNRNYHISHLMYLFMVVTLSKPSQILESKNKTDADSSNVDLWPLNGVQVRHNQMLLSWQC